MRFLQRAGLDAGYDGEQRHIDMYDHAVRHARSFATRGTVRSVDNKYYTKDTMLGAAAQRVEARQRFGIDVARPNVAGLVKAGVEVSSDRRTRRNDSSGGGAYFRRDLQRNGKGVNARARLHICFSDYNSLFSRIEAMDECYELQLP
jgi:5-methyltetrahydropteroyltriglutamate--homocysteine methyltransferase